MEKAKKLITLICFSVTAFIFSFGDAKAASLYFSSNSSDIRKNDTFVVDLKLSSPDQKVNVADGSISFDQDVIQVEGISTGGSIFSLWTRPPVFSNANGMIIFTGGVPNGFKGSAGQVFKIVLLAKESGKAQLSFSEDTVLYLNDGNGTKIDPSKGSLEISVGEPSSESSPKDEWKKTLSEDKTPPGNLEIKLSNDSTMFDNKYFISFFAIDSGSGIKSYEVKEGSGDFTKTESPYVLKDQSLKSDVFVRVTDKAGNYKIGKLQKTGYANQSLGFIIIIVLLLAYAVYFKLKNVRKK
jgi:hypothetical protein